MGYKNDIVGGRLSSAGCTKGCLNIRVGELTGLAAVAGRSATVMLPRTDTATLLTIICEYMPDVILAAADAVRESDRLAEASGWMAYARKPSGQARYRLIADAIKAAQEQGD